MFAGDPIRFGLTGLGNFAGQACEWLVQHMGGRAPQAALKIVCEPDQDRFRPQIAKLQSLGIPIVADYAQLLERKDLDVVWLPLPIDLHRQYTEMTLAAGKPVLCEKPAAGAIEDVDAMITARDASGLPVAIGYQDLYQPAVQELKRRMVRGEFGVVLSASVIACWPRPESYYRRNQWAGKISRDGRWILDSPANNAMAHHLHLALFLLGASERESAVPTEVEAELYRVNEIENYDTCSMRLTFDNGVHALVAMTHACRKQVDAEVIIRTQFARIRFVHEKQIEIHRTNVSEIIPLVRSRVTPMFSTLQKWLSAGPDSAVGATLEMARAHALTISAASESAAIVGIPASEIEVVPNEAGERLHTIRGIEAALEASVREDRMLNELKVVNWSKPASDVATKDYSHFAGPFKKPAM